MIDAAELADRALRRVVIPAELLEDSALPDIRRRPPADVLPLPTAAMIDEMLWRSALAKLEAAKACERATRTIAESREIRAGHGTQRRVLSR